jgi:hypothetical protein
VAVPPAQQPTPVVAQAVPHVPSVSGPQNNLPALQSPNAPTVVATQPVAIAVPTLPPATSVSSSVGQPPAQGPGPASTLVVVQALPQPTFVSHQTNNPGAVLAPTATVQILQPITTAVVPTDTTPTATGHRPDDGSPTTTLPPTGAGEGGVNPAVVVASRPPQDNSGPASGAVGGTPALRPAALGTLRSSRPLPVQGPARESELIGLNYSVVYRNYETQSLVRDLGLPLYALASGYEFFLFLEGRSPMKVEAAPIRERGSE